MSEAAIGKMLGVTESRVSQLLAPMRREVAHAYTLDQVGDRYRDDPEFSRLVVRWITI